MGQADFLAERVAGPTAAQVRESLLAIHADAADFFVARRDASWVPDYLEARALGGSLASGAPWQVGYAPDSWTALTDHLRQAGYCDQTLEASGLSLRTRNGRLVDRFRDRLMLSVRDDDGRTVGFVGRARPGADERTPKYLNSPTTAIYRKSERLFGLAENVSAVRAGTVPTLTEGPLDAIAVHLATSGRNAGVALCGTALTAEHAASLAAVAGRPGTRVVVTTDPDAAGRVAAESAYVRLTAVGLAPWTPDLPPGLDPADLMRAQGARRLEAALTVGARPLVDVLVEHRIAQWSDRLQWVEGSVGAVRTVAPLLSGLDAEDQQRLTRRVVDLTGVSPTTVAHEIAALAQRRRAGVAAPTGLPSQVSAPTRSLPTGQSGRRSVHSAPVHR